MKIQVSLSAKQVGELYHVTTKAALLNMLKSGKLLLSVGRAVGVESALTGGKNYFASFTRSRFGGYHYGEDGSTGIHGDARVMITLDGDKLSNNYLIRPVDYWGYRGKTEKYARTNKEVEERLVADNPEINILKYIKRVDFIQAAVHGKNETYGFDKGKFKVSTNELYQRMLGSLILRLRKNKIAYGFFNSMDDWAKRRNEYSYTGPKDVTVDGPVRYNSIYGYDKLKGILECLSPTPYERLSKKAREISDWMARYPNDIASLLNDYEGNRKPGSSSVMYNISTKIARVLARLNLNTPKQIQEAIAEKSITYQKQQQQIYLNEKAELLAPLIIQALTLPRSEWSTNEDHGFPEIFTGIKDRFSYQFDRAEHFVRETLKGQCEAVDRLRAIMREKNLETESDVVSEIYYYPVPEKV